MRKSEPKKLKSVRVTGGPQWTLGKVGWYSEDSKYVFFDPLDENLEPDDDTKFRAAHSSLTMTLRPLTVKEKTHVKSVADGPDSKTPSGFR